MTGRLPQRYTHICLTSTIKLRADNGGVSNQRSVGQGQPDQGAPQSQILDQLFFQAVGMGGFWAAFACRSACRWLAHGLVLLWQATHYRRASGNGRLCHGLWCEGRAGGAAQAQTTCSNGTGTQNGYYWQMYLSSGTACETLGSGGNYSTTYQLGSSGNMVAGKGWANGTTNRVVNYNAGVFNPGANSYLAFYGWSTSPLIEYYIVENYGQFVPPGSGAQFMGTVNSDGGTYNIYRTQRVNAPSIIGNATFYQYWSVRTAKAGTGTNRKITFANHVNAWRSKGMNLGTMNYQIMATEGFGSNGSSNVTVW